MPEERAEKVHYYLRRGVVKPFTQHEFDVLGDGLTAMLEAQSWKKITPAQAAKFGHLTAPEPTKAGN